MQTPDSSRDWTYLPRVKIIGRMMFDPVWSQRVHNPNGFEILHVLRGRITVCSARAQLAAQDGDLVLIPSSVKHRDAINARDDIEVFFCSMDWEHERDFFKPFRRPLRPILIPLREQSLRRLLEDLRTDTSDNLQADRAIAGARLMTLLMLIYRQQNHTPLPDSARAGSLPTRQHLLLEQARNYIARHYAEHLSLDAIAAALKISPYYLSRVFRHETKFTLYSFLTETRMQKAKMLLADGRKTVAEAAYAVGFDDPHYFSKVFHRHHGCAPTEFLARQPQADLRAPVKNRGADGNNANGC